MPFGWLARRITKTRSSRPETRAKGVYGVVDSGLLQNPPSGIFEKGRRVLGPKVTVTVREREGKSKNLCRSRGRCFFGGVVFCPALIRLFSLWHSDSIITPSCTSSVSRTA